MKRGGDFIFWKLDLFGQLFLWFLLHNGINVQTHFYHTNRYYVGKIKSHINTVSLALRLGSCQYCTGKKSKEIRVKYYGYRENVTMCSTSA